MFKQRAFFLKSAVNLTKLSFCLLFIVANLFAQDGEIVPPKLKKLNEIEVKKSDISDYFVGELVLNVVIDKNGKVREITSVEGPGDICSNYTNDQVEALRNTARRSARKAKFDSATKDGVAIESISKLTFEIKSTAKLSMGRLDEKPKQYTAVSESEARTTELENENSSTSTIPSNSGIFHGKTDSLPKPIYPPAAIAVKASGKIRVKIVIDEKGLVLYSRSLTGHPLLRSAAQNAACYAKFSQTLLDGKPVKISGVITYNFVP